MKRTLIYGLLIFLFFALLFFAKPKNTDNEIVFWTLQMGDFKEYIINIIDEYEKTHDVKIKWVDVPFSEGEKRTLSAMLSDNPPDLINLNPDFSSLLAERGALTFIERSKLVDFSDEIVNSMTYNGQVYAIPWYATSAITFCNKKYSNNIPKTFDDLSKIAEDLNGVYVYMPTITENDTMLKILNKYGINSYKNINSKDSVKVFKMFKDLYVSGKVPKESVTQTHREALEKYMSGQTVYFQGGANFLNMVRDNAPDVYKNTDIAPQIKGSLGQNDFSLMNFVIPYKSRHKEQALDFGLFLTNEENQLELARLTNVIATNKTALKNEFYNKNNTLIEKARSVSAKQLENVNPVMKQQRNQKEVNLLINTAVENILINGSDIQKTLDEVSKKWEQLSEK